MKNLVKYIMILGLWMGSTAHAGNPININPDHPALKFCAVLSNPAAAMFFYPSMWPSIQVIPFPPYIAPGMVVGLTQNTSVVTKVCNVLNQVAQFDTQNAVQGVRGITNELTDGKWNEHLDQVDATYNIANTLYDFEEGGYRKGALESAQVHADMKNFYKDSYAWYNRTFNGKDAEIKSREKREIELNEFANLAYRRAILEEASNCPDPSGNPNYEKIAESEIMPLQRKADEASSDMDFFKVKLLDMGVRIANNENEYKEYNRALDDLIIQGINYQINYKNKTEVRKVPHPSRKEKDGKPKMVDKTITIKTQEFQTRVFGDMFQKFKKNYGDKWTQYVQIAFASTGSEGLLGEDPAARIENEFRDLSYECNPNRLLAGIATDRPDYDKLYDERVTRCREETRINQKKAENLMNYYVQQLQNSTYIHKKAKGDMWTKESWYLGSMRAVNTKDTTEGYQQQQVTCAEGNQLSSAEMDLLAVKQQKVNADLKEIIAKQQTKKTNLMVEKKRVQAEEAKKRKDQSRLINEKNEASKKAVQQGSANSTMTIDGLINVK